MSIREQVKSAIDTGDYSTVIECVPYATYLGVRLHRKQEQLVFEMPFQQKLIGNPQVPALHGGVIAGFMENAALLHLLIEQKQSRIPKPIDFSIDYMRPAKLETCIAMVDVVREGRRVALASIECWQQDRSKLITQARAHFILEPLHE